MLIDEFKEAYVGAAAALWSCRVILFELLANYLPFNDRSLMNLYRKRGTIAEILDDGWFREDYKPLFAIENDESERFINAFQLIAMSTDLDLSGLFQKQKMKLGSVHSVDETIKKIEVAAKDVRLSVKEDEQFQGS
ncbi:CBL-interacting serine/threonine-protein kinase 21-like [Typha angustifolia]|uniref:CBL-interacting serine/threonine-protein kinase 21-like n=1 Tax=Typha angustifolia TaxID=59011 RepID=UPI003C305AF5